MIKERVNRNFVALTTKMTVAEVRTMLVSGYGVVWDENGLFITLLKADHLTPFADEQALAELLGQLPPGILVSAAEAMEQFVQSPAFVAFALGACGAMVVDENQPVGILTIETITYYLHDEFKPVSEIKGFPSDTSLPGTINDKPLIMYCDEFQHRNELEYYNRHKPPECQAKVPTPHLIRKKGS